MISENKNNTLIQTDDVYDEFFFHLMTLKTGFSRFLNDPISAQKTVPHLFQGIPLDSDNMDLSLHVNALNIFSDYVKTHDSFADLISFAKERFQPLRFGSNSRSLLFNGIKSPEEIYMLIVKDIAESDLIRRSLEKKLDKTSAGCYTDFLPILALRNVLVQQNRSLNECDDYKNLLLGFNKRRNPFTYFEYLKNRDLHQLT